MIYNEYTPYLTNKKPMINYEKNIEADDDIDNTYNNEIINNDEYARYDIDLFNVKLFVGVKGGGYPGIWAISFIPGTSTAIARYGNAYSFLPIVTDPVNPLNNPIIYTATIQTTELGYNSPSNIAQGTLINITDYRLPYGSPLGQNTTTPITFTGEVYAITSDSANNIYIGGNFTIVIGSGGVGSTVINDLAKWDPVSSTWSNVYGFNLPYTSQSVFSLAIIGSEIYVGGNFTLVQWSDTFENIYVVSVSSFVVWDNNIKIWRNTDLNGSSINLYDSVGNPALVYTMKVSNNFLYLGGKIETCVVGSSAPIIVNNIFRLTAVRPVSTWLTPTPLKGGVSSDVYAIDADNAGNLYVGGDFSSARNTSTLLVRKIVRWNYSSSLWQAIVSATATPNTISNRTGVNNNVYAVAVNPKNNNEIWFGGLFIKDRKNVTITYIASFNWSNKRWTKRYWTKASPGT